LGLFIEVEIIVPTEDDIPTAKKTILAFLKKI
jgi:adenylate cyclase class IV